MKLCIWTDPLKREAGCNPLPSYCHSLRVAYRPMIRKNLANILKLTATKLETDTTKETIASKVHEYRVRLAAVIMPKDAFMTIETQIK